MHSQKPFIGYMAIIVLANKHITVDKSNGISSKELFFKILLFCRIYSLMNFKYVLYIKSDHKINIESP